MKTNSTIKLKAAALLVVFGLNTIVSFACSLGIDMGFNSPHHDDEKVSTAHIHSDGTKHHHQKKATHSHSHKQGYQHLEKHEHEKNNCCSDTVVSLSQDDKSVPQGSVHINPLVFATYLLHFYISDEFCHSRITTSKKFFVRGYHPPIQDIRIAIRSFQI